MRSSRIFTITRLAGIALAAVTAWTTPCLAADEDLARSGPYVGLGGNFAVELFDDSIDVDNSSGFHLRAGYRFVPNFSLELLWEMYNGFETDPGPGHYEGWSGSLNGKGYILTGAWQPYLLIGVGYLDINYPGNNRAGGADPGDDLMMRFGIGMDACLGRNWAIGPEVAYVLPFSDVEDLSMVTVALGVRYKFF